MDTVTREVVRQEKAAYRKAREDKQQQELTATQRAWQLEWDKRRAIHDVGIAAENAVQRLSIEPNQWESRGVVRRVCSYQGPHHDLWCIFHWGKRVTLVEIPGAQGGCQTCDTYIGRRNMYSVFSGLRHRSLYLGSNGKIYRAGHSKIFEAKLMDRDNARDVRGLIPKLNAMR
jgi:hypothetical protein